MSVQILEHGNLRGETQSFTAWSVEDRATDQLLLSDVSGRTRSRLMGAVGIATSDPTIEPDAMAARLSRALPKRAHRNH